MTLGRVSVVQVDFVMWDVRALFSVFVDVMIAGARCKRCSFKHESPDVKHVVCAVGLKHVVCVPCR